MNIADIIKSGINVTLAISANDLREWHKEVIEDTKRQLEELIVSEKAESYLSAKQVCDMLSINLSTLWRWEKKGHLVPIKIGGQRAFKLSEIKPFILSEKKDLT